LQLLNRKKFLKRLSIFGGVTACIGLYAWQIEPFWLEFVKLKMPIKNLPKTLVGKTLMQISDMHVGKRFNPQYIIDAFKTAQSYQPDFVVYTGDFVSYESEEQLEQLEKVFEHAVIGSNGTVGILGNHDYGKNWMQNEVADNIVDILYSKGIQILRNTQQNLNGLNIIGIDDYWGPNFQPELIMNEINHGLANLVLCHNPDVADLTIS
jgi:uncharacterized protein